MKYKNFARNERIFEAVIRGKTWAAAAEAEGLTTEGARRIANKMRKMMLHPGRLGVDVAPDNYYLDIREMRKNADFWLAQLTKMRI